MNKYGSGVYALALLGCSALTHACEIKDRKVVEIMTDDVGTYDESGNFLADIKKSEVKLNESIVGCKDSPALVQVKLTQDRTAWVNLLEVKVGGGTVAARECKKNSVSHVADTSAPATSGIDPCSNAK
jgi:hypothetical protein